MPGHYLGESARSLAAVQFTADYIKAFDEETAKAKDCCRTDRRDEKTLPDSWVKKARWS